MSDECDVGHNCNGSRLMQQCYKALSVPTTTITTRASQSGLRHTWPLITSRKQQRRKPRNYSCEQVQLIPRVRRHSQINMFVRFHLLFYLIYNNM
jgi:hypothetical protein